MKRNGLFLLVGFSLFINAAGLCQFDTTMSVQRVSRAFDPSGAVYRINPKVDIPITLATTGFTFFGFSKVYSKDNTPRPVIENLNVQNIPRFDRWAADVYSEKAAGTSDYLFYGSVPLPFLLLADKAIRQDAAKIGLLYLQAMSATGTLYTGSAMAFDRFRPYAYNSAASIGDREEGNARNAFFAGHAALVGTATFFTAKVFADYHPDSKLKWVFFGAAAVATGTTGYLRHRGGRHFPSDILVGTAVGTLSGILIPHFHKNKLFKDPALSVVPFSGRSHGLLLTYKL
jgi:membrane-associated phospholipid phosphatase